MDSVKWQVINGNNIDILKTYPDEYFDAIVTDPPYGIEFLGKDWDKNTGAMETWQECYRVLKSGGHMLAFSAARTYHHLATNVEMAGFEIRDQLMWLYGSGFPKAQDIGKAIDKREGKKDPNYGSNKHSGIVTEGKGRKDYRCSVCEKTIGSWVKDCKEEDCGQKYNYQTTEAQQWAGWKTALKPAHEPIVLARKPFKGSTIDNVLKHGVGALNIDASRIPAQDKSKFPEGEYTTDTTVGSIRSTTRTADEDATSRYPSNVLGEIPEYQKFFYCPKVSRSERHIGFDELPEPESMNNPRDIMNHPLWEPSIGKNPHRLMKKIREHNKTGNNHPTVKPVELMKYLVKLVTPPNGKVLDPFNGSGSTGMACVELGYDYVGCELDADYVEIARTRIRAWEKKFDTPAHNLFED